MCPPLEIAYTAEEAGITATARSVPGSQVSAFTNDPAKAPDLLLAQNNPDSAHPGSQAELFFVPGAPLNIFGCSNPEADKAFAAAAQLTDAAERDAAYADTGLIVFEDGGFIPLADVEDVIVHRNGLTDLGTRPAVPWNIDVGMVRWSG